MGFGAACNNAFLMASASWIAFLDGQDAWHPEKIAQQAAYHLENPGVTISYTDAAQSGGGKEQPKKGARHFEGLLSRCDIAFSSVLAEKKALDAAGLFDETLQMCADYDLWLRLLEEREIGFIDQKLAITHGRPEEKNDRWCVKALEKHLGGPHEEAVRRELIRRYEKLLNEAHDKNAPEEEGIYAARLQQLRMGID